MPRRAVGGILVREGRLLLGRRSQHRSYYPGVWDVFGGHVEPGEPVEDALTRELEEELGIVPVDVRSIARLTEPQPEVHSQGTFQLYVVTTWKGEPKLSNNEHSEMGWFTTEEACAMELAHPEYPDVFRRLGPLGRNSA